MCSLIRPILRVHLFSAHACTYRIRDRCDQSPGRGIWFTPYQVKIDQNFYPHTMMLLSSFYRAVFLSWLLLAIVEESVTVSGQGNIMISILFV